MIIDTLEDSHLYNKLNKNFSLAFKFLKQKNLKKYPAGRYDIKKSEIYASVSEGNGKGKEKVILEAHKKYIDIQMCITGEDLIGYKPCSECKRRKKAYDSKKDYSLFGDKIDSWFKLDGNSFAIFFPNDAHAPLAGNTPLKKVVVKVRVK
ncbi:MAG: YhcH/YjgK/YiaL family protein [Candidatus Omnitrophota bacterium]|jgi:YhcH/YjgK/YiaL family protein